MDGHVREEQMRALFGEGRHADADRLERGAVARGESVADAMKSTQLGRRFPKFEQAEDDGYDARLSAAFATFRATNDRAPEAGVERDLIRWNVAREILSERTGHPRVDDAAVARFRPEGRPATDAGVAMPGPSPDGSASQDFPAQPQPS